MCPGAPGPVRPGPMSSGACCPAPLPSAPQSGSTPGPAVVIPAFDGFRRERGAPLEAWLERQRLTLIRGRARLRDELASQAPIAAALRCWTATVDELVRELDEQ